MDKTYCLYVHRNTVNGKQYCGITSQKPEARWRGGDGYVSNAHFSNAIAKYGWDAFEHVIIKDSLTYDEATSLEKEYIRENNLMDAKYGYNKTAGGEGITGYAFSEEAKRRMSESRMGHGTSTEARQKISKANLGEKNGMFGATPWNKGIPWSEETKELMSRRRKGKASGKNHPMYGKKHTEESLKKMSESHKGACPWNKGLKMGVRPANAKRVSMLDDNGCELGTFETIMEAADYVGGWAANISACCKGKVKHASGYVWRYIEEEVSSL